MNEKKKNAQNVENELRQAGEHLNNAERSAQGTGDKKLIERVVKIREATQETHKELQRNLEQ